MLQAMSRDPQYEQGTFVEDGLGIYAGWTVRRGSFAAGTPYWNESRTATLLFAGEEFPDPGAVKQLRDAGHSVGTGTGAYLAHLYENDSEFPRSLNGWFHGLVIDRTRQAATLFNDRYGLHRLYYHESPDALYFAAEAKSILAVRPELRRTDLRSLAEFVACGCVLEDRTLFPGIQVLPGASAWTVAAGRIREKLSYFNSQEWEEQPILDPNTYYGELRNVFARNLPRYFDVSAGQVGISLTGGLDTRMIMAWHRPPPDSLRCYTFGGMFRDNHDVIVARRVAQLCDQPHEVIRLDQPFLRNFPAYADRALSLTDGCVDVSRAADLYINERARELAPVRMTGNYGGEVLRRVRAFKPMMPRTDLFRPEFMAQIRRAAETYSRIVDVNPLSFAVFRQTAWHHFGLLRLEQTQLALRSPYLDNDFVKVVFQAPDAATNSNEACLRLIADGNPALLKVRTDRGLAGSRRPLVGAASRYLLELQFKAEYAYDYGMPQWLAGIDRRLSALQPHRLFLGHHKFSHFRVWYRDALSDYVREMLLDRESLSRPYLKPEVVRDIVTGHLSGRRNYTLELHKLLTLEILHRQGLCAA
jgi:asparagine synthase (glutamine-hydrolysing)